MFAMQPESFIIALRRLSNRIYFFLFFFNYDDDKALLHKVPDSLHGSREGRTKQLIASTIATQRHTLLYYGSN